MILLMGPLLIVWLVCGIWLISWCGTSYRRETGNFWQGVLASALVFLLYFGNEVYAYSKWKVMCYAGAGLHVYDVQAVKGFGMERVYYSDLRFYLKNGYDFIDGMDGASGGQEVYIYKMELGQIVKELIARRVSEYTYITAIDNSPLLSKYVATVVRLSDGFTMGELTSYGYKSGYVFQALKLLLGVDAVQGQAVWCERSIERGDLVFSVVPSIK